MVSGQWSVYDLGQGGRQKESGQRPAPGSALATGHWLPTTARYQAKWLNALFASAILMVCSRLAIASPSRRKAAISSSASRR